MFPLKTHTQDEKHEWWMTAELCSNWVRSLINPEVAATPLLDRYCTDWLQTMSSVQHGCTPSIECHLHFGTVEANTTSLSFLSCIYLPFCRFLHHSAALTTKFPSSENHKVYLTSYTSYWLHIFAVQLGALTQATQGTANLPQLWWCFFLVSVVLNMRAAAVKMTSIQDKERQLENKTFTSFEEV